MKNTSIEFEYKIIDRNGRIKKTYRGKSKSYVLNFMKLLRVLLYSTGETLKDDTGSDIVVQKSNLPNVGVASEEGNDNYGVLFGSGTQGFSVDQYNLASKINHGDGDNLLHYNAVEVGDIDTSETGVVKLPVKRSATNNGSVDVTVNEVGLFVKITVSGTDYYFMLARDDISSSPVTLSPGDTLIWTYNIKTTY